MLKPVSLAVCVLVILLVGAQSARSSEASYCERLEEMKIMQFKPAIPVDDEIYNGLIAQGKEAFACLLAGVTETQYMPDPRQAPPYGGVTTGDLALWVILDICDNLVYEDMFPEGVRAKFDDKGVYAYFAYVEEGVENRQHIADAIRKTGCR